MVFPNFSTELELWRKKYKLVIGIDEVGRGAFAGPVVAGACALKLPCQESYCLDKLNQLLDEIIASGVNDSKKLSAGKREKLVPGIKNHFYWGVGESPSNIINSQGIVQATEIAMRRAVVTLLYQSCREILNLTGKLLSLEVFAALKPYLIIDAFHVKYVPVVGLKKQKAIIKGDGKCVSIAAASIIAKVYRDGLMSDLGIKYPLYHWEKNKGYGTLDHRQAIKKHGLTKLHRTGYIHL